MSFPNFFHRSDIDNFILVYTMAKVGSTALVRSLEAVNIFSRHLQWATRETQAFMDRAEAVTDPNPYRLINQVNRINTIRAYRALRDPDYASMIKVITVVRSPVEQILSHYFHSGVYEKPFKKEGIEINPRNVRARLLEQVEDYLAKPNRSLADLTRELSAASLERIWFSWFVHNHLRWFDEEFRAFFPADILAGTTSEGYQVADNALILRFEELAQLEHVIGAYAERPQFKLLRDNVGADKAYGDLYREVTATIRFPARFVDHLCDSKYVRHFYSEQERSAMRQKWTA